MTATATRRLGASALALLVVVAVAVAVASPARAAAYRYWTYWQAPAGATAWVFATQGPGTSVPADGSVEGWAFGVTTDSANPDDAPGPAPDFDAVCGQTPPQPDRKRVALVVDPGAAAFAPDGQAPPATIGTCVLAPEDASGYEILRSVTEVRIEDGLVCGVAGYPTGECAPVLDEAEASELVARAEAAPTAVPAASNPAVSGMDDAGRAAGDEGGSPLPTVLVITVLAAIAVVLALRYRRTR